MKLFWRGYVCISSRGPLPPLDLELYSRASQQLVFDRQERVAAATAARKDHAKRRLRAILVSENCYVFSNYELEHVRTDFSNF